MKGKTIERGDKYMILHRKMLLQETTMLHLLKLNF